MDQLNRQILQLALPSIVSNITVPLLGLVDQAIVGHLGAAAYIGAVAVGTMIFNVVYWIFGFLRMSTSGLTSQAWGSRDLSEIITILIRSLLLGQAVALSFLILQRPLYLLSVTLIGPSAHLQPLVESYFQIAVWGAPAVFGVYALTGWYVGMQNTRLPMVVSILQVTSNVILSLFFVFALGMKIEGVALGTMLSQWIGFLMMLIFWHHYYGRLLRYRRRLREIMRGEQLRRFFSVNRDIFLRTLFLVAVNLFFTSAGARQGDLILSVNALLMTFSTLFSYFMDGFANAAEALCGRYYGASQSSMASYRESIVLNRRLLSWGLGMAVLFSLLYFLGGHAILRFLTNNADVLRSSTPYLVWASLIPLTGFAAYIFDGIFIGITATRGMLVSSAIAALFFFIIYFVFESSLGNHALWLAFLCFLLFRGVIQYFWLRASKRSSTL
ncbi:MAG: MATE family efflux transporter [Prevotella sp.]|jgi:MATE family multidrug resistance protein